MSFYICPQNGCNRKYKLKEKLMEEQIKQILEQQRITEQARIDAQIKFKEEQQLRFTELESQKLKKEEDQLRIEQEQINLESVTIEFNKKCLQNAEANGHDCCICMVKPCDSAPTPCGHKKFCYECITTYNRNNRGRGCPICRNPIETLTKIF